jgi:hypothetical protein
MPPGDATVPAQDSPSFTADEFIAAFSIILPPEEAREEGLSWHALADPASREEPGGSEFGGPVSIDSDDLLDLLSLVSDDCAARAWRLLGVSREEGERRREAFRRKIDDALRARDE